MKQFWISHIKPHLLPATFLIAITLAVFGQILGHDFLINWDDPDYVTANQAVRGLTVEHIKSAFTNFYLGNYAPVQILSYMLDYTLWGGLRPAGFFFTNLFLHVANGIFVYALLTKVTGTRLWASIATFIFLLHPVQVESVAWISQRKNLLAMFFFLPAIYSYVVYRERGWKQGKAAYLLSISAFSLSLLAKSAAVILPLVLLLYDLCFLEKREVKRWLIDKIPYAVAAGLVAWITLISQGTAVDGLTGRTHFHGGSPLATFFTMLPVFARYLDLLFWPKNLSAFYNPPIKTSIDGSVALSLILLLFVAILGGFLYRRRRDLFFWFSLFFVGLLPVSQIVPIVTLMNDRYLYFPLLGGAAFVAGVIISIGTAASVLRVLGLAVAACFLAALPWLSFLRAGVWKNTIALWSDTARKCPENPGVWNGLAEGYAKSGKYKEALAAYQRSYALAPEKFDTREALGYLYTQTGEIGKGRAILLRLVEEFPNKEGGLLRLGESYFATGELAKAEESYTKALGLSPGSVDALTALAYVSYKAGKIDAAITLYSRALALDPINAVSLYHLGLLYTQKGMAKEGRGYLLRLLRDNPGHLAGAITLGNNYYLAGELAAAEEAYKAAIRINPRSTEALHYLGNVYLGKRDLPSAREMFLKAIDAGGNRGELEYNLACTDSLAGHSGQALGHLTAAVAHGFRDYGRIARNRELDPLRTTPEFREIARSVQGAGAQR